MTRRKLLALLGLPALFASGAAWASLTRSRIADKFTRDAVSAWTVSAASVVKMDDVAIGEGG